MDLINNDDDFENDSLEDEQIVNEIPESPMIVDEQKDKDNLGFDLVPKQQEMVKNSLFTNVSTHPALPTGIVVIDKNGKTLDIRDRIRMKNKTFGRMKFKDFKQAKKKIESEKSINNRSMSVMQNMKKLKNNLSFLISDMDKMSPSSSRQEESTSENFLRGNETQIPSSRMLAENSISINSDKLNHSSNSSDSIESEQIFSITSPDQLNNNEINSNSFISRFSVNLNESIFDCNNEYCDDNDYDTQTILVDKTIDINQSSINGTYSSNFVIDETKIMDHDSLDSSSSSIHDEGPISTATTSQTEQPKSSQEDFFNPHGYQNEDDDVGEVKLKVFKDKKSAKIKQKENGENVRSPIERDYQCDRMFRTLCHNCQNYYSSRQLSMAKLQSLLDDCAKHRGYRSAYRSPPRFWEIDFIDDKIDSKEDKKQRKKKSDHNNRQNSK